MDARRLIPAALIAASACGIASAASGPIVVPLHVERNPEPRLGIDVTIGAKTVRVLADTGSAGLRILAKAVPPDAVRRTGPVAEGGGYGSGLVLHGDRAIAALSIGDAHAAQAAIELVEGFGCGPQRPDCPAAAGGTPEMFGGLFPGIMGLSLGGPGGDRCCDNPLAMTDAGIGRTFIVHARLDAPTLTLNPDPAEVGRFTFVDVAARSRPRGCIRISAMTSDVCGTVLFDTGTSQLVVTTTGVAAQGPFAPGTTATLTLGSWSHTYALRSGSPPLRAVVRRGDDNSIVVGLAALQDVDVYFDLNGGRIALLSR